MTPMTCKSKGGEVCCAESCLINDKSKGKERRTIPCSSPGCEKSFHAVCIGKLKSTDKELADMFFICLRCEDYLKYSAEIAHRSIMSELDRRLASIEKSVYNAIDDRLGKLSEVFDKKLNAFESDFRNSIESLQRNLEEKELHIADLKNELKSLNDRYPLIESELKASCDLVRSQLASADKLKRKKTFIVRNFPECNGMPESFSNMLTALAKPLNLEQELVNVKEVHRIGKARGDGKPRLILVKTNEKTARLFISRARLLRFADRPLNKVYIQENLSPDENKKLAEMRKRAFDHKVSNPGDEAFVRNKKLFINGNIVDEVPKNFITRFYY